MKSTELKVLVTGASGYLASWIVRQLLEQGIEVYATVRCLLKKEKVAHLIQLQEQYPGKLKLFEADLLQEGAFDNAMRGCDIVIHTASPYFLDKPKNIEKELIQPAVGGTKNILQSVERNPTVKRVVLTSSVVALYRDAKSISQSGECLVCETSVNNNTDKSYNPYAYSKTEAEKAAWDTNKKQNQWELITIHPGAIFGPSLSTRVDATSIQMIIQFLNGSFKTGVPQLTLGVVDVRDAAAVHVKAAISEFAKGKYIAVSKSMSLLDIANVLRVENFGLKNLLPKSEVPKYLIWLIAPFIGMQRQYVANNVNYSVTFDNSRSQSELGIKYRASEDTFKDHISQLVTQGLI